ncbi:MAG: hypothetical protein JWP47_2237 [Polaromonas sp.]|nr:hypothetical protein [Polaromonas sp.]
MSNASIPPRFVPTLTEVVYASAHPSSHPQQQGTNSSVLIEAELVERLMQRVDLVLERRLREVVGQLILAHTQALGPQLRDEIELVVRESVRQAVSQELATGQTGLGQE